MTLSAWRDLLIAAVAISWGFPLPLGAQWWDVLARAGEQVGKGSEGKWKLGFDSRVRYETRTENGFGKDPDISTGLVRTRLSLSYKPNAWLKFSGALQDSRAPWYGNNAPSNIRDSADLYESYLEIHPGSKAGFGLAAGRMIANYGEGRLLATPQWGNVSRAFDMTRLSYKFPAVQFEVLVASPVKVRIDEFNRPVLGDRVWGTYNTLPEIFGKNTLELYALRHDQNCPGGFAGGAKASGTDSLGVNAFGGRLFGTIHSGLTYNLEAAVENGKVGAARQRAGATDVWIKRRWEVSKHPLDVLIEYKYASGTRNPQDSTRTSTFDQIYGSHHDRFGHQDLFGWRNIHNVRVQATYAPTKAWTFNALFDSNWLASAKDSLYNGSGKSILKSVSGVAGRHVGEEADMFATYRYGHFLLGGGFGHLFAGQFVRLTSPGFGPSYMYLFHTYAF